MECYAKDRRFPYTSSAGSVEEEYEYNYEPRHDIADEVESIGATSEAIEDPRLDTMCLEMSSEDSKLRKGIFSSNTTDCLRFRDKRSDRTLLRMDRGDDRWGGEVCAGWSLC